MTEPPQLSEDAPRPFAPVADPARRPRKDRSTARVILVDPDGRTLMFRDTDPGLPGPTWWVQPGGGVDPGETLAQAAVREVAEETGYALTEAELIGPLARRHVVHGYSDQVLEQDETFYLARVKPFAVDLSGHTEDEKLTLAEHHWWSREELAESHAWIWPDVLVELMDLADHPDAWPRDLGDMEESTVPDVPPPHAP